MAAKLIFFTGLLGVGGYVGHTMMNHDPSVLPLSREQAQAALVDAVTTLPRRDGDGQIRIWSTGRSEQGVALAMQYAADAPVIRCQAAITAVDAGTSRVRADCGADPANPSAIARTTDALQAPMFDEHIQSILGHRDFNRQKVDQKEAAVVFRNLGGMQREALRRSDEMQAMEAGAR